MSFFPEVLKAECFIIIGGVFAYCGNLEGSKYYVDDESGWE
jgi:hypothetical protein